MFQAVTAVLTSVLWTWENLLSHQIRTYLMLTDGEILAILLCQEFTRVLLYTQKAIFRYEGGRIIFVRYFTGWKGFFVCVRIAAFIMLLQWRSGFVYRLKRYFFFSRSVRSKIRFFQCWFLFIFLHLKRGAFRNKRSNSNAYQCLSKILNL